MSTAASRPGVRRRLVSLARDDEPTDFLNLLYLAPRAAGWEVVQAADAVSIEVTDVVHVLDVPIDLDSTHVADQLAGLEELIAAADDVGASVVWTPPAGDIPWSGAAGRAAASLRGRTEVAVHRAPPTGLYPAGATRAHARATLGVPRDGVVVGLPGAQGALVAAVLAARGKTGLAAHLVVPPGTGEGAPDVTVAPPAAAPEEVQLPYRAADVIVTDSEAAAFLAAAFGCGPLFLGNGAGVAHEPWVDVSDGRDLAEALGRTVGRAGELGVAAREAALHRSLFDVSRDLLHALEKATNA